MSYRANQYGGAITARSKDRALQAFRTAYVRGFSKRLWKRHG
jgi:hypothetical protein